MDAPGAADAATRRLVQLAGGVLHRLRDYPGAGTLQDHVRYFDLVLGALRAAREAGAADQRRRDAAWLKGAEEACREVNNADAADALAQAVRFIERGA